MTEVLLDSPALAADSSLTCIRGIGVIRKRSLSAIGIHTIQELACASMGELKQKLEQSGCSISHHDVQAWIAQAQLITHDLAIDEVSGSTNQVAPEIASSDQIEWQSHASFMVEFQTRQIDNRTEQRTLAHYVEAGTVETWTGIASEPLAPWMKSCLTTATPEVDATPITIDITQVRLLPSSSHLPSVADKTQRQFFGQLEAGELFALEVSVKFAGSAIAHLDHLSYQVQCSVRQLTTGTVIQLGEMSADVPYSDRAAYMVLLPDLTLAQPGGYRLYLQVGLLNAAATPGCFKVPLLKVM